jgi:hypothetical protein
VKQLSYKKTKRIRSLKFATKDFIAYRYSGDGTASDFYVCAGNGAANLQHPITAKQVMDVFTPNAVCTTKSATSGVPD